MADQTFAVQWTGLQALVALPQHIDSSNAGQIREQLLWIINRGAVVLIADLTATVSCDYSGADALARAHHRAVANGTELRLVVTADAVRRVLSVNGLDRKAAVYPDLDAALAAGPGRREPGGAQRTPMPGRPGRAEELLHVMVARIFDVALILQAAIDRPPDVTVQRITEALGLLDDVIREARDHVFEDSQGIEPDRAGLPPRHVLQRSAQARDRSALLQRHVAHTAHALHLAAADTAALLAQRTDLIDQPGRIDYPTEIKRLRALADQAKQMAERWKQPLT